MRIPIRPRLWMPLLLGCSLLNIALPLAHGADLAGKREIIKKARAAYYSLRGRGLDDSGPIHPLGRCQDRTAR